MIRRIALSLVLALLALTGMVGVEVYLAMHRHYLPTSPAMDIGGDFGPPGAPLLRFVVLGDSTAAGVGAGSAAHAYPTLLAKRLAQSKRRVRLVDLGVSGARVEDVLRYQLDGAVAASPDLVFVGIGANDTIHLSSLGNLHRDMRIIVDRLLATNARVVVAGAPDMRAAAFYEPLRSITGYRGRQVAGAISEAASDKGVPVVPLARETGHFFADDPARYYSDDDFHPGPAGYKRWADTIYPYLLRAVTGK